MDGIILNIQKFCVNDGDGIRTTVFFKGCPLHCLWCHNPETQNGKSEFMFDAKKCTHCGRCTGITADSGFVCFSKAKEVCGRVLSSDEVIEEVVKDKVFYDGTGGGITLSGGEPFFQFDFALEILRKAKQHGIHTAVETCGYIDENKMRTAAEYTDLFLFDYKETDPQKHKAFTGVENDTIINNLKQLNVLSKPIVLRCPIIPQYNDTREHFKGICDIANSLDSIIRVEIEPYQSLGESKYRLLGRETKGFLLPDEEQKSFWFHEISNGCNKSVKFA